MKRPKRQHKAWNIIPLAAIMVFLFALIIRIWFPDALKAKQDIPGEDIPGDTVVDVPDDKTPQDPDSPITPTPQPEPQPEPEPESTAPGEAFAEVWSLILVNQTHYLPEGYDIELETVQGKYQMDSRAAEKAKEMIAAAKEDGVDLLVCSAYRSHEKQTSNFNTKLNSYLDQGWTYEDAYNKTATIIAVPGTSEHETGLALDIVTPSYQMLDAGYENTDAAMWLLENAKYYGFILRFPKDKQDITKIIFEPWHYRYVGVEYSTAIMDSGLCLEEWLGQAD